MVSYFTKNCLFKNYSIKNKLTNKVMKPSELLTLCQNNPSKIINAAAQSNFLELLAINKRLAYKSWIKQIYMRKLTKETKRRYIKTLKRFFKANKVEITKEILELKKFNNDEKSSESDMITDQSYDDELNQSLGLEDFDNIKENIDRMQRYQLASAEPPLNDSIKEQSGLDSSEDTCDLSSNKNIFKQKVINLEAIKLQDLTSVPKTRTWPVSKQTANKIIDLKNQRKDGWSDLVIGYIGKHNPHCVLVFKFSHVKKWNSYKRHLPLFTAKAFCKHSCCKTMHFFSINEK